METTPEEDETVQVSFRIPKKILDEVDKMCFTTVGGVVQRIGDRSQMLRTLIVESLERREKAEPLQ